MNPHFCFLSYFCFQSTAMAFETVNEENVYTCTGQPLRSDIANMVEWMLNEDFNTVYNSILDFWLWHCKIIIINTTLVPQSVKRGAMKGVHKRGQRWNVVPWYTALCWKGWAKKTQYYVFLSFILFFEFFNQLFAAPLCLVYPSVRACLR